MKLWNRLARKVAVPVLSAVAATGVARAQASGKAAVAPPPAPAAGSSQASSAAGDVFETPLRRSLQTRFGATFSADFTEAELSDAQEVLSGVEALAGDLKPFHLTFKKVQFSEQQAQLDRRVDAGSPVVGYAHLGLTDYRPRGVTTVFVAPKTVLDAYALAPGIGGVPPKGEEGLVHDFKWTLSHELTHDLVYQTGLGVELAHRTPAGAPPSPLYSEWLKVAETVQRKARPLGEDANHRSKVERPEGFPTLKSYYPDRNAGRDGEQVADCGAYLVTGSRYADGDKLLRLKLDFTRKFFGQIKSGQLKPTGATPSAPLLNGT